jgi:hypothetical protein
VEEFTQTLITQAEKRKGASMSLNEICVNYSYDVMSLLAYGDSTKFMEGNTKGTAARVLGGITSGIAAIGALMHIPWVT